MIGPLGTSSTEIYEAVVALSRSIAGRTDLRSLLSGVAESVRRIVRFDYVGLREKKNGSLPLVIFVAEAVSELLIGFLEAGLRSHADGCDPNRPVGHVEGWFVLESDRGKGIGALLLRAAEDWARSHGCVEMASDTWIDHTVSQRVHEALKFEVVDRCVHYRKAL